MRVDIVIIDDNGNGAYEKEYEMEFIPNLGEGILLGLEDDDGWIDDGYYCEYAVCVEKYQVLRNGKTAYFVCRFKGEDWHGDL